MIEWKTETSKWVHNITDIMILTYVLLRSTSNTFGGERRILWSIAVTYIIELYDLH